MFLSRASGNLAVLAVLSPLVFVFTACGGEDEWKNTGKPATRIGLTASIYEHAATVSPRNIKGGPIQLTFRNFTDRELIVSVVGPPPDYDEPAEPVTTPANSTGRIATTFDPGVYELRIGSTRALPKPMPSGRLVVRGQRRASNQPGE